MGEDRNLGQLPFNTMVAEQSVAALGWKNPCQGDQTKASFHQSILLN